MRFPYTRYPKNSVVTGIYGYTWASEWNTSLNLRIITSSQFMEDLSVGWRSFLSSCSQSIFPCVCYGCLLCPDHHGIRSRSAFRSRRRQKTGMPRNVNMHVEHHISIDKPLQCFSLFSYNADQLRTAICSQSGTRSHSSRRAACRLPACRNQSLRYFL